MSSYGLQGGFRDFVVFNSDTMVFGWSRYSLFSVVLLCFLFITVYPHVLHVHGNVPKCYPRMLWVVLISLLCMKNKSHIG